MKILLHIDCFRALGKVKFFHGFALIFLCLSSFSVFAQLPDFTLNVTHTEETCTGNASINFTVTNTDPSAAVTYTVYMLPDTSTAIAVLTTNLLDGLTAGTYQVVATQVLSGASNTQTQNVTIINQTVPLAYTIAGTNATCGNSGSLTVSVFSGTGVLYEIISGPVTALPQASPFFGNLPAGVYQVRVFDECGEGWVSTYTLLAASGNVSLEPGSAEQTELVTCNSVAITNTLNASGTSLTYPLDIVYTVFPPGGVPPIVTNTTLTSGDVTSQEFTTVIPYYGLEPYTTNITVTDACGNIYFFNDVLMNIPYLGIVRATPAECGEYYLTYVLANFKAPLTINFLSAPAGFDPVAFNPDHPGPFEGPSFSYGDSDNGVPYGFYSAQVTDDCGRVVLIETTLEYVEPSANVNIYPYDGCQSYMSEVIVTVTGYTFVTAIITNGPPEFASTYPIDVSSFISSTGLLTLEFMPTGIYTIIITDDCGNTYTVTADVPPLATTVSFSARTGCENGKGAIRIRGNSTQLQSAIITSAPAGYTGVLPHDVSFNISVAAPDVFSMTDFPPGTYTFDVVDSCNVEHLVTVIVNGYAVTVNTYNITPHCGSFDLEFFHTSNATTGQSFWLQKWYPALNIWGHPETGEPYVNGSEPSSADSYALINNTTNYSISYLGDFRIIKRYESFENGNVGLFKTCIETIQEFTFINALEITDIQKITCNGLNSDVLILAQGFPPLTYQITSKNGSSYFVDNGANNVFANLESAVYNFLVFDTCGNIVNRLTDVALLPSLINIPQPSPGQIDLIQCDEGLADGQSSFNLANQNPLILGSLPTASYNISYHTTLEEATAGINPLPLDYTSGTAIIYARIEYNNRDDCYDTVSFNLIVNDYPTLDMESVRVLCEGEILTLTADPGFLSYQWSTGETTSEITVSEPGTYTLQITQLQNGLICTAFYTIEVMASSEAAIQHIDTVDWTYDQNSISVFLESTGLGNYTFSIDGVNYQSSNTFYGLLTGIYTVFIKDEYGCKSVEQQVSLLGYPNFFTPNRDGYHDFWHVFYAKTEPNIKVHVFDRYGKLLTIFGADSPGWDGTYNGKEMPSSDYWFKVIRQDGREHLGHFAMKR